MSITNRTAEATKTWDNFDSVEIVKFLNDSEYLCTPGFILRRQIMKKFPALVAEAEEKSHTTCDDLTDSGNVSWPIELLKPLSRILKDTKFKMCSSLDIEARHWRKYLSDAERCKRDMAIKLIFALEMDDETADKFLLANGSEPLSLRNPFDYACKVAHAYGFSYEDAVTLFRAFEAKYQKKSDSDFTQLIKRDLERARKKKCRLLRGSADRTFGHDVCLSGRILLCGARIFQAKY